MQAFVDAWGPWVSGPSERIEATIEGEGDSLHLTLGQPDFELPWSMKGVLDGHALDVTANVEGTEATSAGSATLHLELDSVDQSVSWKGRCQLADLNDDLTGHGHVRWGGSEPEWTLNLLGQGARLLLTDTGFLRFPTWMLFCIEAQMVLCAATCAFGVNLLRSPSGLLGSCPMPLCSTLPVPFNPRRQHGRAGSIDGA